MLYLLYKFQICSFCHFHNDQDYPVTNCHVGQMRMYIVECRPSSLIVNLKSFNSFSQSVNADHPQNKVQNQLYYILKLLIKYIS